MSNGPAAARGSSKGQQRGAAARDGSSHEGGSHEGNRECAATRAQPRGRNSEVWCDIKVTCKRFEHMSSSARHTSLSPSKPLLLLLLLLDEATGTPTFSKARGGQRPERAKSGLTSCCTQPSGRAALRATPPRCAPRRNAHARADSRRGWSIDLSTSAIYRRRLA